MSKPSAGSSALNISDVKVYLYLSSLYSLLMAYTATIATVSKKYKWLAWVVYDQNFPQEAASNPAQPWPQKK